MRRRLRVHEVARALGIEPARAAADLRRLGHDVSGHLSTVPPGAVDQLERFERARSTGAGLERVRVHQLARQVGMTSRQLLDLLDHLDIPARTHASSIHAFDAALVHRRVVGQRRAARPGVRRRRVIRRADREDATANSAEATARGPVEVAPPAGEPPSPTMRDTELLRRLLGAMAPYWRGLLGLLALHLVATPLVLLQPVPLKLAIDSVVLDHPVPGLLDTVLPGVLTATPMRLLLVAGLLQVLVMALIQAQSLGVYVGNTAVGERMTLGFRARLFRHVQRLSLAFHDRRGTYESLYRIEYDAPSLQHTADTVIPFISSAVTLVVILAVTARIDLQLALIALLITPVLFWLSRVHVRQIRQGYHELKELETSALGVVQEVLSSVRVVKAFGREDSEEARFTHRYGDSMRAKIQLALRESSYGFWINVTTAVGTALVLYVGVRNVLAGRLTEGELLMVLAYLVALYGPLEEIAQRVGDLQSSLSGAQRAFELLDELPEVGEPAHPVPLDRARGDLTFEDVTFGYEPGRPVLDGVSFHVPAGTRVGIVGRTGAGKTTLVSLVMRFYDPQSGQVRLDGRDVRDHRVRDLRSQFAMMLQDPVLFSTSIGDNIRYARPDATHEELESAARAAGAHDFITALPDGYDTLVGERGMLLSGGERQRVSLARAFLRDAPVLILDEPTSSVDTETEGSIMRAMEELMAGRTTLMIAHRRSTLEGCSLVLDVGDDRQVRPIRRVAA